MAALGIGATTTGTTQHAATKRRPWNHANPKVLQRNVRLQDYWVQEVSYLAEGVHLTLLFAVEQRIVVLHGDKWCQSISEGVIWVGLGH